MGTRSNTYVVETWGKRDDILVNMYRQMDGYPSGMGKEIADFLIGIKMRNGMTLNGEETTKYANGTSCLAAQLVAHLKTGEGSIYLEVPNGIKTEHNYTYVIRGNTETHKINIEVFSYETSIFKGAPAKFAKFCTTYKD